MIPADFLMDSYPADKYSLCESCFERIPTEARVFVSKGSGALYCEGCHGSALKGQRLEKDLLVTNKAKPKRKPKVAA